MRDQWNSENLLKKFLRNSNESVTTTQAYRRYLT